MPKINQAEFDELLAGFLRDIDKVAAHQKEQQFDAERATGTTTRSGLVLSSPLTVDALDTQSRAMTSASIQPKDCTCPEYAGVCECLKVSCGTLEGRGPKCEGSGGYYRVSGSQVAEISLKAQLGNQHGESGSAHCRCEAELGEGLRLTADGPTSGYQAPPAGISSHGREVFKRTPKYAGGISPDGHAIQPEGHVGEDGGWEPDWRDEEPWWSDSYTAIELYRDKGAQ